MQDVCDFLEIRRGGNKDDLVRRIFDEIDFPEEKAQKSVKPKEVGEHSVPMAENTNYRSSNDFETLFDFIKKKWDPPSAPNEAAYQTHLYGELIREKFDVQMVTTGKF